MSKKLHDRLRIRAVSKAWWLGILGIAGLSIGLLGVQIDRPPASVAASSAVACPGICVQLKSNGMHPNELAVKVGEYVQFASADGQKHIIAEGDGADDNGHGIHGADGNHDHVGGLVSGEFGADEAWQVLFKKAGTYKLHDHFNPSQKILVVVYDDTKD